MYLSLQGAPPYKARAMRHAKHVVLAMVLAMALPALASKELSTRKNAIPVALRNLKKAKKDSAARKNLEFLNHKFGRDTVDVHFNETYKNASEISRALTEKPIQVLARELSYMDLIFLEFGSD